VLEQGWTAAQQGEALAAARDGDRGRVQGWAAEKGRDIGEDRQVAGFVVAAGHQEKDEQGRLATGWIEVDPAPEKRPRATIGLATPGRRAWGVATPSPSPVDIRSSRGLRW